MINLTNSNMMEQTTLMIKADAFDYANGCSFDIHTVIPTSLKDKDHCKKFNARIGHIFINGNSNTMIEKMTEHGFISVGEECGRIKITKVAINTVVKIFQVDGFNKLEIYELDEELSCHFKKLYTKAMRSFNSTSLKDLSVHIDK